MRPTSQTAKSGLYWENRQTCSHFTWVTTDFSKGSLRGAVLVDMSKQRIKSLVLTIRENVAASQTGTYAARRCALEQAASAAAQLIAAGVTIPAEFAGRL